MYIDTDWLLSHGFTTRQVADIVSAQYDDCDDDD